MSPSTKTISDTSTRSRQVLRALQERIGPQKFNAWFRHGTSLTAENGTVQLRVPNPFVANWIEQHYLGELGQIVKEQTGETPTIRVSIDPNLSAQCQKRDLDMQANLVARATTGRQRNRRTLRKRPLKYTLDDFVVGDSNKLAYTAALSSARSGRKDRWQLFVHGSCGVGKTHLLQGICDAMAKKNEKSSKPFRWKYVTGEQFTNDFIQAIRTKKTEEFRSRYRRLDLLAIDDVHFLAAKRATQDEFLHTFNSIDSAGKQILLASDTHPRLLGDLNEQLISRFQAGMVVRIDSPDQATRIKILRKKAQSMKLKVSADILRYIALHIRGSVRELEGALVKLSALAVIEGDKIDLAMARDSLSDHLVRTDSAVTLGDIEATVSVFFGISPAEIHSSRRTKTVCLARMVAMTLARRHTRMSFPEIGRFMGKNHSSVVLATQRMSKLLAEKQSVSWSTPCGSRSMPAETLLELMNEEIE